MTYWSFVMLGFHWISSSRESSQPRTSSWLNSTQLNRTTLTWCSIVMKTHALTTDPPTLGDWWAHNDCFLFMTAAGLGHMQNYSLMIGYICEYCNTLVIAIRENATCSHFPDWSWCDFELANSWSDVFISTHALTHCPTMQDFPHNDGQIVLGRDQSWIVPWALNFWWSLSSS